MKKSVPLTLCVAVLALFFQGCASKQVAGPLSDRAPQSTWTGDKDKAGLTDGGRTGKDSAITEEDLAKADEERRRRAAEEEAAKAGSIQDVFFEFDSYALRDVDTPVLQKIATLLNNSQTARLTVEGHCDERGTTEYNLALGQKRADAAKEYLVRVGVSEKRIKAISYGKEAPLQAGHTEDDWSQNRRAHFVVTR